MNTYKFIEETMKEAAQTIREFAEEKEMHIAKVKRLEATIKELNEELAACRSALIKSEAAAMGCFHERSQLRAEVEQLKTTIAKGQK